MIVILGVLQLFDVIDLDFNGNSNGTTIDSDYGGGVYVNDNVYPEDDDDDDDDDYYYNY